MYEFKGSDPNNLCSSMLAHNDNPNHAEHIIEFKEMATAIAQEQINIAVPALVEQMTKKIYSETINAVLRAIEYDITTCLTISFNDLEGMFKSKSARKFVSDAIIKEIKKSLNNVTLKFTL